MCISCKTMGVTSLGPHTRPGCNLGYCRDLFFVLNDVDLYTVCFSWTFGDARGLGLNCACVPLVTRLRAVNKTMPRMWCSFSHGVTWFGCPYLGACDVILVTWAICLILIGRDKFCCALIGRDLL